MKNRQKQISSNESDIKSLSIFQSFHLYFLNNQKINAKLNAAISKLSYKQLLNFLIIGIEIFCSIGLLAFLANKEHIPLLIAPFGATATLIYGTPKSKMANLRNVLAGHLISAFIGICCYQFCGNNWYAISLSLSLSVIFMLITNTMHPPGGATAVLCVISQKSFHFLLMPLGMGLLVLILIFYAGNLLRYILKIS